MREENPSIRIVEQRIRNRLFEYLEMVVEFQDEHPPFDMNEALNQWEDWVMRPVPADAWEPPTYTLQEAHCLRQVDAAWEALCDATPRTIVDERSVLETPEWSAFAAASAAGLHEMRKRGKLPEEWEAE
ncbi:MAG: hypothetical protein ACU837_03210 [Gammaproteobacteria bacterium]